MLKFELSVASRHLRSGGGQTLLTISAVAAGVTVVVFISSVVFGVRAHISDLLTSIIPHVIVKPKDRQPAPFVDYAGLPRKLVSSRVELTQQQRKDLDDWRALQSMIRHLPEVAEVVPAVVGQGFLSRGGKRYGVQVYGAQSEELDRVMPVTRYMGAGRYVGLKSGEIVFCYKAAQELNVCVGDRLRLTSNESLTDSFRIVGLYDTGEDSEYSKAYVTLRDGQRLFATAAAVHTVLVRADNLYHADRVADRIMAVTNLEAKSWSRQFPQWVASLTAYDAVAYLVSIFSLIASGFAIASVLIVSVLQKSKQIGILKSMGARGSQILTIFLLEGFGIALVGSLAGAAAGSGIVSLLTLFKQPVTRLGGKPEDLFPHHLTWGLVIAAVVAATISTLLAAALPARRAAKLDPVQVMR